jgi:hypothetical protein
VALAAPVAAIVGVPLVVYGVIALVRSGRAPM